MPVLEQQVAVRLPSMGRLLRKRAFDIVCAALGLLVLSPVLLLCAPAKRARWYWRSWCCW